MAAAKSATMASAPDLTAPTPDTTSDPVLAAHPMTRLVPEVEANARAEAAPKKKRVASKHPRYYYPGIPFGGSTASEEQTDLPQIHSHSCAASHLTLGARVIVEP